MTDKQTIKYLKDKDFMKKCQDATEYMLVEKKFSIDIVCKFIKMYQKAYLALSKHKEELGGSDEFKKDCMNHFTFEYFIEWAKTQN